jgi:L-fuconolactonase
LSRLLDTHVHFWDPTARHHDWLAEAPPLQRRFGPEEMAPGEHELLGVVFVQADCRADEALDEVHWVQELAQQHPVIRGIVAYAPVHLGSQASPALEALAREPLVVGVRRLLQDGPAKDIVDQALIVGVGLLPGHGLTFDVCVRHHQLPEVAELVRSCPETSFVLDHLGKPPVAAGELGPWGANIAAIAEEPNVVCKLSGLTTEAASGWTEEDVRPYLEYALEAFGPQRCMVGSDWPVATLRTTVGRWFDIVTDLVAGLAPDDQAAVMYETALSTYGLAMTATDSRG